MLLMLLLLLLLLLFLLLLHLLVGHRETLLAIRGQKNFKERT